MGGKNVCFFSSTNVFVVFFTVDVSLSLSFVLFLSLLLSLSEKSIAAHLEKQAAARAAQQRRQAPVPLGALLLLLPAGVHDLRRRRLRRVRPRRTGGARVWHLLLAVARRRDVIGRRGGRSPLGVLRVVPTRIVGSCARRRVACFVLFLLMLLLLSFSFFVPLVVARGEGTMMVKVGRTTKEKKNASPLHVSFSVLASGVPGGGCCICDEKKNEGKKAERAREKKRARVREKERG